MMMMMDTLQEVGGVDGVVSRSFIKNTFCLHYLLPEKRDQDVPSKLRHPKKIPISAIMTALIRKSFIFHCLKHYK